jgi:hypothetical protein
MAARKAIPSGHSATATRREPRFTIEEAFRPFLEPDLPPDLSGPERDLRRTHLAVERGVRATALLLDLVTREGNRPVDGETAIGIGRVLEFCADEIARVEKLRRHRTTHPLS